MKILLSLLGIIFWLSPGRAQAQSATWSVASGGNGHYYRVIAVTNGIDWNSANSLAHILQGHLATITSSNENAFVHGLASQNTNAWYHSGGGDWYGPWLGGRQLTGSAEPADGWKWVTDEPFAYENWAADQPNNNGGAEDGLQFVGPTLATAATWNDLNQNNITYARGYVVEYDTGPAVSISASPGQVLICWTARTNTLYTVQYNSTLSPNTWLNGVTNISGNGTTNCVIDPTPPGQPQRYYRVKVQ